MPAPTFPTPPPPAADGRGGALAAPFPFGLLGTPGFGFRAPPAPGLGANTGGLGLGANTGGALPPPDPDDRRELLVDATADEVATVLGFFHEGADPFALADTDDTGVGFGTGLAAAMGAGVKGGARRDVVGLGL